MERFKRRWYTLPRPVRKPVVLVVGWLVVAVGVVLLPLPGPGWAVIFVGLAILSTEFEWAKRLKQYIINKFKSVAAAVAQRRKG